MAKYGLIGHNIGYSFSKTFFNFKFEKENIDFFSSEFFQLSLMSKETFLNFAKKIENISFWDMTFNGTELKLELKLDQTKGI